VLLKEQEKRGKIWRQNSKTSDGASGCLAQDLEECLAKIRPLSEHWKQKYDRWKSGTDAKVHRKA
jgi:hypothetical protein